MFFLKMTNKKCHKRVDAEYYVRVILELDVKLQSWELPRQVAEEGIMMTEEEEEKEEEKEEEEKKKEEKKNEDEERHGGSGRVKNMFKILQACSN